MGPIFFHTFGQLYTLPVPFWLYAWGAGGALVISFLAAGYFMRAPAVAAAPQGRALGLARFSRALPALRGLGVAMLLLTIATGLFGNRDPYRNLSMNAFWIAFMLGVTYATAVAGNFFEFVNPWRTLTARLGPGRVKYPDALGAWPALAFFLALVWIELTVRGTPFTTGAMLGIYTLMNAAGVWLVGAPAWFRHCEVFSVYLRMIAKLAPVACVEGAAHLRAPGAGALEARPRRLASVVFVLAMLAATAYDGLRETRSWFDLFYRDPLGIVTPLVGEDPLTGFVAARPWHKGWDTLWLVAAPFLYFAAYALALWLARLLTRAQRPLRALLLDFAYTLLPIVLAYHFAHYFTLLLDQGPKLLSYLSDPFGFGWDLFGTTDKFRAAYLPDLTRVWHLQVAAILLGHVGSVVMAHRVALRVFETRGQAVLSQAPMLLLMLGFTVSGLWILSQPLVSTMVR